MKKTFKAYYVWPHFPSVSMSGNSCALHCKHCDHTYLDDMQSLPTPKQLFNQCQEFKKNNAVGFLLSGGCDTQGKMLNLEKLLPTVKKIKEETDLIIKLHTGIVDKNRAEEIVSAGVDIASLEIVGSNESIKEIFDFHASIELYQKTLENLERAGMPFIVPHICIGLHHGELKGEQNALQIIKDTCTPAVLVMIILRPTKGTPMQNCPQPKTQDIYTVIQTAKTMFPTIDISLGCIRPRQKERQNIEQAAIDAGVTRMEIPTRQTIDYLKEKGYMIKKIPACCALPKELEYKTHHLASEMESVTHP